MGEYADSLKKKKTVPAQAVKAQASETKQQASVEKKYTAPVKNKGESAQEASKKAKADALKEAQKNPVRDAHDKPSVVNTPTTISPLATQTPASKSAGTSGDGNTGGSSSNTGSDETFININPSMDPVPTPSVTTVSEPVIVKTPTRNVTDISSLVPQYDAEYIQKILFENLSAIELSIVERHDTIEGINQKYSIISNLSEIRKKYDIARQLTVMDKFKPLTRIFTINIEDKIPQEDYLILEDLTSTYQYLDQNNEIVNREKGYYYIDTNGDLVIELIGLERNQEVEVLIDTNGTIYKVES